MCARYTIYHATSDIVDRFAVLNTLFDVAPRYNLSPTNVAPVIYEVDEIRRLEGFRWGLVPFWAKDISVGQKMLNARAETIAEKPAFRNSLAKRRCIVPADGFYEWTAQGRERQPIHIQFDGAALFGFAGLWDTWRHEDEPPLHTYTIITVPANDLMAPFHDRMPAILRPEDEAMWLDPDFRDPAAAASVLRPRDPSGMRAYKVDKKVNRAGFEDPSCIAPLNDTRSLGF